MFAYLSGSDPRAKNFHPVTSEVGDGPLFSPLSDQDLEWTCAGGFATETQIFYNFTPGGKFVMLQVIHASVGVWFPTIQFVVHIYDPNTKERIFSSTNVSNFAADKRSSKADEFTIKYNGTSTADPNAEESYTITARPNADVQVSVTVSRPSSAPGWRIAPNGGKSFFGQNTGNPDGYVVHRFWPRTAASGHVIYKGRAIDVSGPGMLVHAIQGMRPDKVAARWNFAHFQSEERGGVSAIQMEFTTTKSYGSTGSGSGGVRVNIGSIVVDGKLVAVTGETHPAPPGPATTPGQVVSRASHVKTEKDPDTGYLAPTQLRYDWQGTSITTPGGSTVSAKLELEIGPPNAMNGLVEKVDLLHEMPSAVKAILSGIAGVKPIIYQWVNPAELVLSVGEEEVTVKGWLNNEATFISD